MSQEKHTGSVFEISDRKSTKDFHLSAHYEHSYQVVYIKKGAVRYHIGEQIYENVHAGEMILLNTLDMHSLEVTSYPYERILFQMDPTFFQQEVRYPEVLSFFVKKPGSLNHRLILPEGTIPYIDACMSEMVSEYQKKGFYWEMVVGSDLRRLFIRLYRDCRNQFLNEAIDASTAIGYKVMQYLDRHFDEDISVGSLADQFFLSKHYISHAFHDATGYSIINYVIKLRMNRAKALLVETDLPVSEIAVRCGYTDFTYFTKLFRRHAGMAPLKFRKTAEQENTIL